MSLTILKPNRERVDSLTIDGGHGIITSHVPEVIDAQQFVENIYQWRTPTPESIAQFGLFGSDLNYHTYYPDVPTDQLKPKDEEFIEPMFRLLSATIVSKNWNPTDFGAPGVLKASMGLLLGQTVNCDHSTDIGNAIGSVSKVVWQEAYKDGSIHIPAGINGVLKIDGKANPRIARGILMEPPSIHSNSVTVQFKWDKSHPELTDEEFWDKLGTYDSKGQMIRRMVTEIIRYHETSLVSHGADPYAQKINQEGKLNNPIFAQRTWNSFSEYTESKDKIYAFEDYKELNKNDDTPTDNNKGGNPDKPESLEQISKTKNNTMTELETFLASLFGNGMLTLAEGQDMTAEVATEAIRSLIESNANHQTEIAGLNEQITNLTTERDTLSEQVNQLNTEISSLRPMATIGTSYATSLREETTAAYRRLMGDEVDETIINMLSAETTGVNTLESLRKDYTRRLEEKFPLKCAKCGSHDVSRASSVQENNDEEGGAQLEEKNLGNSIRTIYANKLKK